MASNDEPEDVDQRRQVSVTTVQDEPEEEISEAVGWRLSHTVEAREKLPAPTVRLVNLGKTLDTADAAFDGAVEQLVSSVDLRGFALTR